MTAGSSGRLVATATASALLSLLSDGRPTAHTWRLVDGRHWQIVGDADETAFDTDSREGTRGACAEGMVEVSGPMRIDGPAGSVEALQAATCLEWLPGRSPVRCARFDAAAWASTAAQLPTLDMRFCIDRFEYPNAHGVYPLVDVTWAEATALCVARGARLCSEAEWTFACEGAETSPYPYGYVRDADACVIDRPWRPVEERALTPRDGVAAMREIDRLWQGEPSGSRPRCRSTFGVYDLTGNVDEWTTSVRPGERPSILKGGYWGPVRTRCRPSTRAHGEAYSSYQQGFRCCRDVP